MNDVLFCIDTTGSMYTCLTQVRRDVSKTVKELFEMIPDLRVGIIAFGDYCDGPQCLSVLEFTDDLAAVVRFVNKVPATDGGDADECHERVLNRARSMHWGDGDRALVMISDANPHAVGYRFPPGHTMPRPVNNLSWQTEAQALVDDRVRIYAVQALNRSSSTAFYEKLASLSGTPKLDLPQFADVTHILTAICYNQAGQLEVYKRVAKTRGASAHVMRTLDLLSGKPVSARSAAIGSRFQVLDVGEKTDISGFVNANGLVFEPGRGFYEFTKKETIQEYKEVVAQNKKTGAIISGKRARSVLGIPEGRTTAKPDPDGSHRGFIQSTSFNRNLMPGTKFLYELSEK